MTVSCEEYTCTLFTNLVKILQSPSDISNALTGFQISDDKARYNCHKTYGFCPEWANSEVAIVSAAIAEAILQTHSDYLQRQLVSEVQPFIKQDAATLKNIISSLGTPSLEALVTRLKQEISRLATEIQELKETILPQFFFIAKSENKDENGITASNESLTNTYSYNPLNIFQFYSITILNKPQCEKENCELNSRDVVYE